MNRYLNNVRKWVHKGGPDPTDFDEFNNWLDEIAAAVDTGKISRHNLKDFQDAFGDALSQLTLQGISLQKPRGYAGDFEIIDRVYQRSMTTNPDLIKWDNYFLNTRAARAVRNRKDYFIDLIESFVSTTKKENISVLNIASGPARDVFEILNRHRESERSAKRLLFDCVEYDEAAILYARTLCFEYLSDVRFSKANAFRFKTKNRYPLIWSAGLFDYLDDRRFTFLLQRLYAFLEEDGELVIGNFSDANPTRPYMEVMMDWELYYRSAEKLIHLAEGCGISRDCVRIGQEPEGINLFLHIRK